MEYQESDLGCAAYLITNGCHVLRFQEVGHSGRLGFVFENQDRSATTLADEYFAGAMVCAKEYSKGLRTAKTLISRHLGVPR
jgi:hypothetical protein